MIFHKPWLQAATPAIAEGAQGRELPEGDLAWKHFRIKGLHLVFATLYLDHSIGITGVNVEKLGRAAELTDGGRRLLIIAADVNMETDEWDEAILKSLGLGIVKAGCDGTCKTSNGRKQLDYLLVSIDLIPFISNMKVVRDVAWSPHSAVTFDVDRRPERVHFQTLSKPAPLPYAKNDNGLSLPWCTTAEEWNEKLRQCKGRAEAAIDNTRDDDSGTWQHASSLGITEEARKLSIWYAQWSMAVEDTIIEQSQDGKHHKDKRGRGMQPSYKWETLASKSSNLPIEHIIWSLPKPLARAGSDLFSTLWTAIAGALRAIASAIRLDEQQGLETHVERSYRLYNDFFSYLTDATKSPLSPSLKKLELKDDRWRFILNTALHQCQDKLDE